MCRVLTTLCLAGIALTFVACGAGMGPPAAPGPGDRPTVEVTAAQLAQDFTDDREAANLRYFPKTLVISGTVGRLTKPRRYDQDPGPDDDVDMVLFFVPVKNTKTGEQTQYELRCQFRPSLPAQQRRSLGLEKGKQVTLRGRYEVGYWDRPLAGFGNCSLVHSGRAVNRDIHSSRKTVNVPVFPQGIGFAGAVVGSEKSEPGESD